MPFHDHVEEAGSFQVCFIPQEPTRPSHARPEVCSTRTRGDRYLARERLEQNFCELNHREAHRPPFAGCWQEARPQHADARKLGPVAATPSVPPCAATSRMSTYGLCQGTRPTTKAVKGKRRTYYTHVSTHPGPDSDWQRDFLSAASDQAPGY